MEYVDCFSQIPGREQGMIWQVSVEGKSKRKCLSQRITGAVQTQGFQSTLVLSYQIHDVGFIFIIACYLLLHPSYTQPLTTRHYLTLSIIHWPLIPAGRCGYSGFDLELRRYMRLHLSRHLP